MGVITIDLIGQAIRVCRTMARGWRAAWLVVGSMTVCSLVHGVTLPAGAGPDAERRALAQVYEQRHEASRRGDLEAIFARHDRSYVLVDANGKTIGLTAARRGTQELLRLLKDPQHRYDLQGIDIQGDRATVRSSGSLRSTLRDRPGVLTASERYEDQWRRRDGRWWLIGTKVLASESSIPPPSAPSTRSAGTGQSSGGGGGANAAAVLDQSRRLAMACYGPSGQTYRRECDQLHALQAQLWARCQSGAPQACDLAEQVSSYVMRYQAASSRPRL